MAGHAVLETARTILGVIETSEDWLQIVTDVDAMTAERSVLADDGANEEVSSSIQEHVKNTQRKSSGKVDLLWHKDRERKATPYRSKCEHYEEDEDAEYSEQYYYGHEEGVGQEEDEGDCDNLCDMFREMGFGGKERKGLPRGEGTHIRFLYGEGDDEIADAMVVKGEEEVLQTFEATQLNGLPAPRGRHWRFVQEDEGEDDGGASSQ